MRDKGGVSKREGEAMVMWLNLNAIIAGCGSLMCRRFAPMKTFKAHSIKNHKVAY